MTFSYTWAVHGDFLLKRTVWKGERSNLTVEEVTNNGLSRVTKVNINSDESCCYNVPLR